MSRRSPYRVPYGGYREAPGKHRFGWHVWGRVTHFYLAKDVSPLGGYQSACGSYYLARPERFSREPASYERLCKRCLTVFNRLKTRGELPEEN